MNDDPLARARERGGQLIRDLIIRECLVPCYNSDEILTVEVGGNKFRLPSSITSVSRFADVVRVLRNNGHDDWSCILFFLNMFECLGDTPTNAIRRGNIDAVIRCANTYMEQGAS